MSPFLSFQYFNECMNLIWDQLDVDTVLCDACACLFVSVAIVAVYPACCNCGGSCGGDSHLSLSACHIAPGLGSAQAGLKRELIVP